MASADDNHGSRQPALGAGFVGLTGSYPAVGATFHPEPFGRWYLLDKLAVGGMAEVFRAKSFGEGGFEKVVVIKRILDRYADNPEFVEMFIDEAKLSARLQHPNIAQIHDFGRMGRNFYLVMEAVEGRDLKAILRQLGRDAIRMPVRTAAYVGHETAKALDYAHRATDPSGRLLGVIHRDVSPSNIMLGYDGRVKIVDFGIAQAESEAAMTESAVLKGKFSYMSPEQADGEELDRRSDLFSLGICLWEALAGERLFRQPSELLTLEAIRSHDPEPPSAFNPEVPPELDSICLKALKKDPALRYQHALELQEELQAFLLPDTPDRIRPSVSRWMEGRFSDAIRAERQRLDVATKVAADIHYGKDDLDLGDSGLHDDADLLEPDPDPSSPPAPFPAPFPGPADASEATGSVPTMARPTPPPVPRNSTDRVLVALVLLMLVAGGAGWWVTRPAPTATLDVTVLPANLDATITLDGQTVGARVTGLDPSVPHELTVRAEGYQDRSRTVQLQAGQVFGVEVRLEPAEPASPEPSPGATPNAQPTPRPTDTPRAAPRPTATPRAAATPRPTPTPAPVTPPIVQFHSSPSGALVFVDGRRLGRTPLDWDDGRPGRSYNVEFRQDGYESLQATVTAPEAGESVTLNRTLSADAPAAAEPGKLNVQVSPGWAKVFVDGAYVSTTPLFGHELPPGKHSIRLVNERSGLDQTDDIAVESGKTTIKSYKTDP